MENQKTKSTALVVAKVNSVSILVGNSPEKLVPIKPICLALGIDAKAQRNRIERDEILNSVGVTMTSTAADGKVYNMVHLPLKYALGWIFTIDHNSVNQDVKENVLKFKMQCYDALYDHFVLREKFLSEQNEEFLKLDEEEQSARRQFNSCKDTLSEIRQQKHTLRMRSFEEWKQDQRQMTIPFAESEIVEPLNSED